MTISFNEARTQLITEAKQLHIELSDSQADALITYLNLVIDKNTQLNLTRIVDMESAIRLHLIDSLLFKQYVSEGTFIDIGTGAGFPGIPLLLTSPLKATLLDSVGKKVNAVNEFLSILSLSDRAIAIHDRAESYAEQHRHQYDFVVARAVAQLNTLIEYASPLLHSNGKLICSKGNLTEEELTSGLEVAKICGFTLTDKSMSELPHNSGHREILCFTKTHNPSVKLPRRIGLAKNQPLA